MAVQDSQIQVRAKIALQLFPRPPKMIGGPGNDYGIIKWRILESYAGNPITDHQREAVIKGSYGFEPVQEKAYSILAKSTYHPKYGQQYELLSIKEDAVAENASPADRKAHKERPFLATFLTENQIDEMYKTLSDPLAVIETHDIEVLKTVRGIGDCIASKILERYELNKDVQSVFLEIGDVGLSVAFVRRLQEHYGSVQNLLNKVRKEPYALAREVKGIGFERADRIALQVGIASKSPERVLAFMIHSLEEQAQQGNSWISLGLLTSQIYEAFGGAANILEVYEAPDELGCSNNFQTALQSGIHRHLIAVDWTPARDGSSRIYLQRIKNLEQEVASELMRLARAESTFEVPNWKDRVAALESQKDWEFTEEQISGIELGISSMVCLITGGAGTGKSTLVAGILAALEGHAFVQTALSGKAAARLEETTGEPGTTIHRLLGFDPENGFLHDQDHPIDAEIVVLDEISLVGGEIFLALLKALKTGTKLIILGDMGQLEAIGCMNVAHDLLTSPEIPTLELTTIHRQAQKSGIKQAATMVREHRSPVNRTFEGVATLGELRDMHFMLYRQPELIMDATLRYFRDRFSSPLVSRNVMNIQVLSPLKDRGNLSVAMLNKALQEIVNPGAEFRSSSLKIVTGRGDEYWVLAPGDKVLCTRNNYQLKNIHGRTTFVFNGWVGIVTTIKQDEVHVLFPHLHETVIFSTNTVRDDLMLGYACTVHKYQGSSAPVVLGVMDYTTPPQMRTTELIYTLITRAEKECLLIGQSEAVDDAIRTSHVSKKQTFLPGMLSAASAQRMSNTDI